MRRVILPVALAASMAGCASTDKGRAVQLVVASDAAADEIADQYESFVNNRVAECDAKLDPEKDSLEDAKNCLGVASSDSGKALKVFTEILVAAQLAIKLAVECEDNPLKVPEEFRANCLEGQKADWKALGETLASAWDSLRPFLTAIRGAS